MLIIYKQKFRNLHRLFGSSRVLDFRPVVHASWLFLFLAISSNSLFSLPVRHFVSLHFRDFTAFWICACLSVMKITQVALELKGSRNSLPCWLDSSPETPIRTSIFSLPLWRRNYYHYWFLSFTPYNPGQNLVSLVWTHDVFSWLVRALGGLLSSKSWVETLPKSTYDGLIRLIILIWALVELKRLFSLVFNSLCYQNAISSVLTVV